MSNLSHTTPDILTHNLEDNISRRKFIRQAGIATIGASIAPLTLFTQDAEAVAPWLAWVGKTAAAAAIGWIVEQLLDRYAAPHLKNLFDLLAHRQYKDFKTNEDTAERLAKVLDIAKVNPKPTNDRFHNKFASPYAVANRAYQFNSVYSKKCCAFMKLNHHLRLGKERHIPDFTDLSIDEIQYIAEIAYKERKILIPYSNRHSIRVPPHYKVKYKYYRFVTDGHTLYSLFAYKSNRRKLKFERYLAPQGVL